MQISDVLTMELSHEAVLTRKSLERVPDNKLDWQPHPKSFTMGKLASHLAEIPQWIISTIKLTELALVPGEYKPFIGVSQADIVAKYDATLAEGLAVLKGVPDSDLLVEWALKLGDKVMFKMPRVAVIRGMIINHSIHHRAQLGLYLRLNDISVPAIYGPSADEQN